MKIKVCELFAGVGGFRLGLGEDNFEYVFVNQWEPNKVKQYAYDCYNKNFGYNDNHVNEDISLLDKNTLPDFDLLVGGFPCQDYSIRTVNAKGIEGKKGVLWWEIRDTIEKKQPKYILLENVDRLLKSPSKQRGRDFAIMLSCLNNLGYSVEWRVINACDYGFPQKRKRVFIFAIKNDSNYINSINDYKDLLHNKSIFTKSFPIVKEDSNYLKIEIGNSLIDIQNNFTFDFKNYGYMNNGKIYTQEVIPDYSGEYILLKDILEENVDEKYYLNDDKIERIKYCKSSKAIERTAKDGFKYIYREGALSFPDKLDKPARTILTSEGTINRTTHVILDPQTNRIRILTPIEVERLNGFKDNWTNTDMTERFRYFCMGNALVIGIIEKLAKEIINLNNN